MIFIIITIYHNSKLLEHPNLVSLLGYTATVNQLVLIMKFINGKNLHVILFGKKFLTRLKLQWLHVYENNMSLCFNDNNIVDNFVDTKACSSQGNCKWSRIYA